MSVINIQTAPPTGQAAVTSQVSMTQSTLPSVIYIQTTDTYATVTATGYLTHFKQEGFTFSNNQIALVSTTDDGPIWLQVAITYANSSVLSPVVSLVEPVGPGDVVLPTIAGALAVYSNTAGTLSESIAATNSVSTSSATPGTIRSIKGLMIGTGTPITSGNLVGVRGEVDYVSASGGFMYGVQGKIIPTGTLSGSSWNAGVFGQLDISAATINAGQTAPIWGDYGTTSHTLTDATGMYGIAMTNTTAAVLAGQLYLYGGATNLMLLSTNVGLSGVTYFKTSGTGAGSWGNATPPTPTKVLTISVDGTSYYLPLVAQNT